jgi:hypothetical protein
VGLSAAAARGGYGPAWERCALRRSREGQGKQWWLAWGLRDRQPGVAEPLTAIAGTRGAYKNDGEKYERPAESRPFTPSSSHTSASSRGKNRCAINIHRENMNFKEEVEFCRGDTEAKGLITAVL